MKLAPADQAIALRRAAAQAAEGRSEAAIALLEQELDLDPAWREGHAALARLRGARGEREHFTDSYERALRAAPRALALSAIAFFPRFPAAAAMARADCFTDGMFESPWVGRSLCHQVSDSTPFSG
jgi:tetratricopeptide (TPR) repeat protein